jgi:hypothetical protein
MEKKIPNYLSKTFPRKFPNYASKICVLDQKVKGTNNTFLKLFLNEMIRNIKIHNILNIIDISKSIEPNKCTH